jgi:CubicO group peptidase (beta-lactamase class C family)
MGRPRILISSVEGGHVCAEDAAAPPVPWWSVSKTVLAAVALALVAEGRLALDAPLAGRKFTLRQLLQHTAGLPDYGGLAAYQDAVARRDEPWSEGEIQKRVSADRLLFQPGCGWAYSNIGYLLVRGLIEAATGDELGRGLQHLVLAPLGVPGVRLARTPRDLDATAWGNAAGYHPGWVYHGLLVGTATEAALFLHRLMAGRLLPPSLLDEMRQPRPLGGPVSGRPWRTAGYGLGLMIDLASPRGRCFGHTGQGPGSTAAAYHFSDLDPPCTAAAFAPIEDQAVVERAVQRVPRPAPAGRAGRNFPVLC